MQLSGIKRARVKAFPYDDEFFVRSQASLDLAEDSGVEKQVREGKAEQIYFMRWRDSTGNGAVKNYTNFSWDLNSQIEGYSKMEVMAVNMTNQYEPAVNFLNFMGIKINEISSPVRTSADNSCRVTPTFMVPNMVWLQGVQNPFGATPNNFVFVSPQKGFCVADIKGLTISTITMTLTDETLAILDDLAAPAGYYLNISLKVY